MKDVYVQIPAYRDRELGPTLAQLFGKARRPERLRVRVLWQREAQDDLPAKVRRLPGLELVEVPYQESKGCNWARNLLQRAWRDEAYTLFIDSHHRFVDGWDEALLDMYEDLVAGGVAKPIITGYLPAYHPEAEPRGRRRRPYRIYPLAREQGLLTRLTSYPIAGYAQLRRPVEADFASLHFLFAPGLFNREIQFDPKIYFFGDEIATSLRAFTWGYDLFHPHVVLGWHAFDRGQRVPHWNDHPTWRAQHRRSLELLEEMYRGRRVGRFGLGRARRVAEYEERILVDLIEGGGVHGAS